LIINYLLFVNEYAFSASQIDLLEIKNNVSILDIYGNRTNLTKNTKLKNGDYLKSGDLPVIIILKNKTKICFASQSSLKINIIKLIKNNHEINFNLAKGNFYFSVPSNTKDVHNFSFNFYKMSNLTSDFIFSKNKDLEIFNFHKVLKIHSKKTNQIDILPYSNYKITKNGFLKEVDPISKYNKLKPSFLQDCLPEMTKKHINKINKSLRYKCSSHNGRLICGNQ
jgi:hypothetical protein|tara:strand:- start:392 stop:1063 length:672 start_codon:yes stop_codon:yes gene_type:complete